MAVTLEEVEKLRTKANVSYEEAKQALEDCGGDLLEAIIRLERSGKTRGAAQGGFFTTRPGGAEQADSGAGQTHYSPAPSARKEGGRKGGSSHGTFWAQLKELLRTGLRALRTGNTFEVWRNGELMTSMPVLILILLIFVPWISLPLLIVGLFFGCRYRFSGPDLPEETMNNAMGAVSDTVDGMVDEVRREFEKKKKR